jgi:transcriptional regulator with XRE-family HTH domain
MEYHINSEYLILAYPSGVVNMDNLSAKTTNPVSQAVRRLRLGLGDTQQQFANRLGLAISTVVRYELSRPPSGKALAQLDRVAMEHGLDECALIFRNAFRDELAVPFQVSGVRPPSADSVGFFAYPQTPEEEAMVFDVLSVMRKARDTTPPSNSSLRDDREQAKKELKALLKATKRARGDRIESVEEGQLDEDLTAAIVRLHNLGMPPSEITERLKSSTHIRVWTDDGPLPKVEAVLAEYKKKAQGRKSE